MDRDRDALMRFYEKGLTVNKDTTPTTVLTELLAENYVSYGSVDDNDKASSIRFLEYIWTIIPDMKVEPREIIREGNRFAVRGIASGTPAGDFLGLPRYGTKSYRIMTIDIITVEDGKLIKAYHLEDWLTAMAQLKS